MDDDDDDDAMGVFFVWVVCEGVSLRLSSVVHTAEDRSVGYDPKMGWRSSICPRMEREWREDRRRETGD